MGFDFTKAIQYFRTVVTQHYSDFEGRVIMIGFLGGLSLAFAVLLVPLMFLLGLIMLFAVLYPITLCIQPGTPGPDAYGPQPALAH